MIGLLVMVPAQIVKAFFAVMPEFKAEYLLRVLVLFTIVTLLIPIDS